MFPLIPYPHLVSLCDETLTFPATCALPSGHSAACANAADTLSAFAYRTHGVHFATAEAGAVSFFLDPTLEKEAYSLTVTPDGITVTASDGTGLQNGVATLIQLMEPAEGGACFTVPAGRIEDAPGCSWRGIMIDLARDWHEFPVLLEYVDMCRFFKIRTLHLHFTDDQSYTLPSRAFPRLSTPGRSYTEEQIAQLVAYAAKREVLLLPEIDVPGHCTSFAEGYGDIFGTDGIICQNEASMTAMEALFRELCGMFPASPYIHIGGDEAAIEKWTTCPKCLSAFRERGVDVDGLLKEQDGKSTLAQIMYATFIARMAGAVLSCGRTPVVWEGFGEAVNHMIPAETVVMSWENFYQVTPSLQKAGFRLLNCSWSPMYVVTPDVHWSPEEVYNWNVYTWHPVHGGSPYIKTGLVIPPTDQVEGGQLLAWGDKIMSSYPVVSEGVREEQRLIEERVPALSENTWNREKVSDYAEFSARCTRVSALYQRLRGSI